MHVRRIKPKNPFAIQLLLVDAEGGKIEASIRKGQIKKFSTVIVEGEVYSMTNFIVLRNIGSYRATRHEFRLFFNSNTNVFPSESVVIPSFGFSFMNSEFVANTGGESNYLLDVMGVLTTIHAEKSFVKDGETSKLIVLELADDKGTTKCAFFGDSVNTVNQFLALGGADRPVVVLQLAKVKSYRYEVSVQNVMNASRLLWNPQIPEALQLKNG